MKRDPLATVKDSNDLPPCEGPRLNQFVHYNEPIKFHSLLSENSPGEHGYVFRVEIKRQHYALKMASIINLSVSLSDRG